MRLPGKITAQGSAVRSTDAPHRMLHRAWEDFALWSWAKRNVVAAAHPPRVPRKGRQDRERAARASARPVHAGRAPGSRRHARPGAQGLRAGLPRSRVAVLLGERTRPRERHVYKSVYKPQAEGRFSVREPASTLVAGVGFEPTTSGL
jgi:hypothetical protein